MEELTKQADADIVVFSDAAELIRKLIERIKDAISEEYHGSEFPIIDPIICVLSEFSRAYEKYEKEYGSIIRQYENYFKVYGIIAPEDFQEFVLWVEDLYPNKSIGWILCNIGINISMLRMFHEYKERQFTTNNPPSLNIPGYDDLFKEQLFDLMIELPIIKQTEKSNLFYALFGDPLVKKFMPIDICSRRGNLFYYLIYKLTGHRPDGGTVPGAEIRHNVCLLFGINNKERRMPTLTVYPLDFGLIDDFFKKFAPKR